MSKFFLRLDQNGDQKQHETTDDFGTIGAIAITAAEITALSAAMDADSQIITNINIDSGSIDGVTIATSDVTVGAGKTLNVSAGTLTTSDAQDVAILTNAVSNNDANQDFGDLTYAPKPLQLTP